MSARHCGWCGVFVASSAEPLRFVDVHGNPIVTPGPLCPPCAADCRDLAASNVVRAGRF